MGCASSKPTGETVQLQFETKQQDGNYRTGKGAAVPADEALTRLKRGNERYVASKTPSATLQSRRKALSDDGQLPMAALLSCADSRCPVESIFDVAAGDVFVCRNAGNTIAQAEGSVVASMEYCMQNLQTQLLVVMGHTKCGAINGAVASIPAADAAEPKLDASVLENYLVALTPAAKQAKAELPSAPDGEVVERAIRINVQNTMSKILEVSGPLREMVQAGKIKVEGAIYDITTGQVEFIGGPPSVQAAVPALVRTAKSDYVPGPKALATLKAGNASYASGQAPAATQKSRIQALASDGQLPMAAVLGCADSRCPVELMFNVAPGDIFVCRNAGNAIAKAEGNIVASMEYCMAHLKTKLLVVLGHTKCGALNGALASIPAADAAPKADASALEQYLVALTPAAKQAKAELPHAPDPEVAELAIRINVKNTMRSIVQISEPLRKQWQSGDLLIEGAIYDITTGRVEFIGGPEKTGIFEPTERPNSETNPCCSWC